MENKSLFNRVYKEIENDDNLALKVLLEWMKLRCVLEQPPVRVNGEFFDDNGKKKMNEFLERVLFTEAVNGAEHAQIEAESQSNRISEFVKNDGGRKKQLRERFVDFIAEFSDENEGWGEKENAKEFIRKLSNYRESGVVDSNLSEKLMGFAKKINNDPLRYIYELIQNADDCEYPDGVLKSVKIDIRDSEMEICYPEKGMRPSDIIAISTIGESNKKKKKKTRIIGEKGIGFKTIFSACTSADIYSGNFRFNLKEDDLTPEWIDQADKQQFQGTRMVLHLKGNWDAQTETVMSASGEEIYQKIIEKYGVRKNGENPKVDIEGVLQNCPIFFTNKIDQLKISCAHHNLTITRSSDVNEGSVTISYRIEPDGYTTEFKCLKIEKQVPFTYEEYRSRYKDIYPDEDAFDKEIRDNKALVTYPVIIVAPDRSAIERWRSDHPDNPLRGNVFTYLPTFTNVNAPISIQIPYELNEDRSCMWIEGLEGNKHDDFSDMDGKTTKWNARLFREVFKSEENNPSLLQMFYGHIKERSDCNVLDYLPFYKENNHQFFRSQSAAYDDATEKLNCYCRSWDGYNTIFEEFKRFKIFKSLLETGKWYSIEDSVVMLDAFMMDLLKKGAKDSSNSELIENILNCFQPPMSKRCLMDIPTCFQDIAKILGGRAAEGKPGAVTELADYLLDIDFNGVVEELKKEEKDRSCYLKNVNPRDIKLIFTLHGSRVSYSSKELWIALCAPQNVKEKEVNDKERLGFFRPDQKGNVKVKELLEEDLFCKYEGDVDDCWKIITDRLYKGQKIQCSLTLYRNIMEFFYMVDGSSLETCVEAPWVRYARKMIQQEDESTQKIWRNNYEDFRKEANAECRRTN